MNRIYEIRFTQKVDFSRQSPRMRTTVMKITALLTRYDVKGA